MATEQEKAAMAEVTAKRLDPKEVKKREADFKLHVALIVRQDGLPLPKARFVAWCEGEAGLARRLGGK